MGFPPTAENAREIALLPQFVATTRGPVADGLAPAASLRELRPFASGEGAERRRPQKGRLGPANASQEALAGPPSASRSEAAGEP